MSNRSDLHPARSTSRFSLHFCVAWCILLYSAFIFAVAAPAVVVIVVAVVTVVAVAVAAVVVVVVPTWQCCTQVWIDIFVWNSKPKDHKPLHRAAVRNRYSLNNHSWILDHYPFHFVRSVRNAISITVTFRLAQAGHLCRIANESGTKTACRCSSKCSQ